MERLERRRLDAVRKQLMRNLASVEELLKNASGPKRHSKQQSRERAVAICQALKGSAVSDAQLRGIVQNAGLAYQSVGALFGAGYLKRGKTGTTLGVRGCAVVGARAKRKQSRK